MESDLPPQQGFWTRGRRLWAAVVVVAVAALWAAGQWLPGIGLRYGLLRSLHSLGWTQASVSDADLSLFKGAVLVRQVSAGGDLGRMLGIDGVDLQFRWKPLFSRRVSVEHLNLDGVEVDIRREGNDLVVNGLPLSIAGNGGETSAWGYGVTNLTLTGSKIHLQDGVLAAEIEVERLELADLKSWDPSLPVRFQLRGRINGAAIDLSGTATPFADRPQVSAVLSLRDFPTGGVAEALAAAGLGHLSGRLDADLTMQGGMEMPVTASGKVSLADGGWSDGTTTLAAGQLTLEAQSLGWDGAHGVDGAGILAARDLKIMDGGVTLTAQVARMAAKSAHYDLKAQRLVWDGDLHGEHGAVTVADSRIEHEKLDWSGTSRFDFAANAMPFLHAEGKAAADGFALTLGTLNFQAQRLTAQGAFEHARPDGMLPPLAGSMTAVMEQPWLRDGDRDWLHADHVDLADVRLAPGKSAHLGRMEAKGLAVLRKPGRGGFPWRLEARQAVFDQASLAADGSGQARQLSLVGMTARVTRTKAGLLGLPDGSGASADQAALPRFALGKLRLGGDGRIDFEDRALSEPVRLRIEGVDLTASDLDSGRTDHDSPFTAKARIGTAQLSASGSARLFAAQPGGEMSGSVRSLDLPPLSPYAADNLGVHLQTGQLDADVKVTAEQGKLAGDMRLVLSELFVAQPDPNAPLAKSADMPVETVLDLLRDSNNRINLSIPVHGDLANPNFDISDAVGQAVGGALKSTVFTTFKVAFPLAGLISLVIDDSDSRRLALDPLAFAAGSDTLGEAEQKRLGTVAGLMGQRPALKLTLCGVATQAADGPALAEQRRIAQLGFLARLQKMVGAAPDPATLPVENDRLSQLAEARAQAAKTYLVDQGGIDAGRLFTCRPRVDGAAQALPRVDLVL